MTIFRLLAIMLIAAGIAGLVYGGFSYTKETHDAQLGPVELSVKNKQSVNLPDWASIGAIAVGVALIFVPTKSH